jgi:hypothetical protein
MKGLKISVLALAAAGLMVMEGCKKYDEGPALSFRSRAERVANTWRVAKYLEGGVDMTNDQSQYPNGDWTFEKKGDLTVSSTVIGIMVTASGTWDFTDSVNKISYTFTGGGTTTTGEARILMLKEKEMWLRDEMGNSDPADDKEYHFLPN